MTVNSEIDAIKALDEALTAIDKDARERVLGWATSKYLDRQGISICNAATAAQEGTPPAPTRKKKVTKAKSTKKSKTGYKQVKDLDLRPSDKQSVRDFVAEKNPTNQKQKCVVALYYLFHILELEKATINHIYTIFKDVGWPIPADLQNTLHQAGTAGWLDTADSEDMKITPMGENIVEHDLPKKVK